MAKGTIELRVRVDIDTMDDTPMGPVLAELATDTIFCTFRPVERDWVLGWTSRVPITRAEIVEAEEIR